MRAVRSGKILHHFFISERNKREGMRARMFCRGNEFRAGRRESGKFRSGCKIVALMIGASVGYFVQSKGKILFGDFE